MPPQVDEEDAQCFGYYKEKNLFEVAICCKVYCLGVSIGEGS